MKYPEYARRLKEVLANKGMTAQDLANKSGVGKSSISQYVNGMHKMSGVNAIKIANALDTSLDYLLCQDGIITIYETKLDERFISKEVKTMLSLNEENQNRLFTYAKKLLEIQEMENK